MELHLGWKTSFSEFLEIVFSMSKRKECEKGWTLKPSIIDQQSAFGLYGISQSQAKSQQTSTHSKLIGKCRYKRFKISTE